MLNTEFKFSNIYRHFITITQHRHMVIKHCVMAGIPFKGLGHDLSKYSPIEFINSIKYYTGTCSPNVLERQKTGASKAWMHHQGRNTHHFEYWIDYNAEAGRRIPIRMPLRSVIEMFCDRVAASKIYLGESYNQTCPYDYFLKNLHSYEIHADTADFLGKLLKMLAEKGEKYTFSYIRFYLLLNRDY